MPESTCSQEQNEAFEGTLEETQREFPFSAETPYRLASDPERKSIRAECLLTYSDLLELEWVLADKVHEWEWRGGLESLVEQGEATLSRIQQMIKDYPNDADDLRPDPKGGRADG